MRPYIPGDKHLEQSSNFDMILVQNGCLEIRLNGKMDNYQPFLTHDHEGFDINVPDDWILAEALVATGGAMLPLIKKEPYGVKYYEQTAI